MRTVQADGIDYLVVWDGALGPRPFVKPQPDAIVQTVSYQRAREIVCDLLDDRRVWLTKELRIQSELGENMFWCVIQHLKRQGITASPGRGTVRLVKAAA